MKTPFNGAEEPGHNVGSVERYAPCLALLRSAYPALSEAERQIADFVLANPDLVLLSSVTELARESGVGASTVTRLAVKLGYQGYPELRTALAVELLNRDETGPEPLGDGDDAAAAVRKVVAVGIQNLHDTAGLLDPAAVTTAAEAIVRARRVELLGNRLSAGAAGGRCRGDRGFPVGVGSLTFGRS